LKHAQADIANFKAIVNQIKLQFTVNVGDKMKGLIGGCHTEPQENVDLNGG
jgi:hypothetical protein